MVDFSNFIEELNLITLLIKGELFSFTCSSGINPLSLSRIDRVLLSAD